MPNIYIYDSSSIITAKLDALPDSGNYCTSEQDFDLDLNYVVVGAVGTDHTLTYYTIKAKPAELLAVALKAAQNQIAAQQSQISVANDAIAELSILIAGGAS